MTGVIFERGSRTNCRTNCRSSSNEPIPGPNSFRSVLFILICYSKDEEEEAHGRASKNSRSNTIKTPNPESLIYCLEKRFAWQPLGK